MSLSARCYINQSPSLHFTPLLFLPSHHPSSLRAAQVNDRSLIVLLPVAALSYCEVALQSVRWFITCLAILYLPFPSSLILPTCADVVVDI
ncbi:hypothetical protein DFH08DRAFT_1087482 [Mycena albidolilacea]|uniref:Uncharacterized protein n=1 Tax=Mycena albidolilacea TaxID=1033008 RepID=A0AAD6Z9Y1_9AGAR|nr:hypothetical protein DFH08DRAFT_1087482 [Mycena albidolilacea]